MRTISDAQRELIDAVMAERASGDLSAAVLEKDIHVTETLHALAALKFPHVTLVFCGGTSLSKAYGFIERMSEDVDLKVVLEPGHGLSRAKVRQHLGALRQTIIETMQGLSFTLDEQVSRNENRYFATGWHYAAQYRTHNSLRSHLSVEFTLRTPRFGTQQKPVGYLVDRLAERQGASVEMACIAVEETLAEKVLSFLRRHAEHRAGVMEREWDSALIRHIYDTCCIVRADTGAAGRAAIHFPELVAGDVAEFTRHTAFTQDPKACLARALDESGREEQTQAEYGTQLLPLVYGAPRPSFAEAFEVFRHTASALIDTL